MPRPFNGLTDQRPLEVTPDRDAPVRRMTGHEAVARQLRELGVSVVFGLIGDDVALVTQRLAELGARYVCARHENQAVAMADVYARTSGRPGVVLLAGGPGVSNGLTAINTAHHAGSAVLVITGSGSAVPKPFALRGVCSELGIEYVAGDETETLLQSTRAAMSLCAGGRTVVYDVRVTVLDSEMEEGEAASCLITGEALVSAAPAEPDPTQVAAICDLFEDTVAVRRPVILAGSGAVKAGAGPALRRLGEQVGAVLVTTLKAPALFAGDEFELGVMGTYSSGLATELVAGADLVVAFGASLNRFTTYDKALTSHAIIAQVDTRADAFGRYVDVEEELRFHADARLTAEALSAELETRGVRRIGYRTPALADRIDGWDPVREISPAHTDTEVDPRLLAAHLDDIIPENRTLILDGGRHQNYLIPYLTVDGPSQFIQMSAAGSIGLAVGGALGAALGDPGRLSVACVGDASFMMALADIETAVREKTPMLVVVSNDEALGAEVRFLELNDSNSRVAEAPTPDLAAVAGSLGAVAVSVRSLADLAPVPALLRDQVGPVVLDCRINAAIPSSSIDFLFTRAGE